MLSASPALARLQKKTLSTDMEPKTPTSSVCRVIWAEPIWVCSFWNVKKAVYYGQVEDIRKKMAQAKAAGETAEVGCTQPGVGRHA